MGNHFSQLTLKNVYSEKWNNSRIDNKFSIALAMTDGVLVLILVCPRKNQLIQLDLSLESRQWFSGQF